MSGQLLAVQNHSTTLQEELEENEQVWRGSVLEILTPPTVAWFRP